jgi:hypothetical protein
MKVEVNKPKPKFQIISKGNQSLYYEQDVKGNWLLKKVWCEHKI